MRSMWTRLLAVAALAAVVLTPFGASAQNSPFPLQQTATLQNAAVATGNGNVFATGQMAAVTFQVTGTFVGTVAFEGSNSTTYVALTCFTLDSQTSATGASTTGIWRCNVTGLAAVRARVSAWTSGSITVTANGTSNAMAVRDQINLSGAITGQLRGTQTTAPTCGTSTTTACTVVGTDSFIRGLVGTPPNWKNTVVVTFNTAFAAAPSCTASWDGTLTYGYYVQAVTPTTTTATLKLGGNPVPTGVAPGWSPGDAFSLLCAGTQ